MDNLINNAMAGLPSFAGADPGVANTASIAMQWQQQLVTPALAMTIVPGATAEKSATHAAIDTSLLLSLQQVTNEQGLIQPALTQQNWAQNEVVHAVPEQPGAATLNSQAETGSLVQLLVLPSAAPSAQANESVVQTTLTSVSEGQKTQVESRLLSWGNAGQGVLSYISAYINGNTATGAPHLKLNTSTVTAVGEPQSVAVSPPPTTNQSPILPSISSVGQVSTRQLAEQQKDSVNAVRQNQKVLVGYDITPQALFFVLSGQQGYRATVRDYFNKEDTLKRLYQLQQDNTFGFSNVQEIWLNGKPLNPQRQQETDHAG